MRIPITTRSRVLVLTGAGISAESGVPTFRDAGGLWEGNDVTRVASPEGFAADPLLVWRFYSQRRAALTGIDRTAPPSGSAADPGQAPPVEPNAGHRALVALERQLGDRFLLVSQNVDGLHAAAGSTRLISLHGELMRSRCTSCDRPAFADTTAYRDGVAPMCGRCREHGRDALLRPDIVWFGEAIAPDALARIDAFMTAAAGDLIFVAVGTSGLVFPAAGLVDATRQVGGTSWLVNLDPPANASRFDHVVTGAAARELPALLAPA